MPKDAGFLAEKDRDSRITAEFQRIFVFFEDLPENKKSIVLPLIQNAAFMRVTLDDLQRIIAEQGPVEEYRNGETQYGMKQSAALQSYNSLIKNYAAVIKTLFGLLPQAERPKASAFVWEPKTVEEIEEDRRREEEHLQRINREIEQAAEMQRRQREQQRKE